MTSKKTAHRDNKDPAKNTRVDSPDSAHDSAHNRPPSEQQISIVGIGSSAGGLDAYKKFFNAMPADSGLAFILIPHLDPSHKSLMVELLEKQTRMPVCEAGNDMAVEPNSVYIIPPNKFLSIHAGKLQLKQLPVPHSQPTAIDFFLRSLAEDSQDKAIGIILSGTGSHGTVGLQAIKGNGGMTMVQDPETAEYDSMPQNAITSGIVDYVLSPEHMPQALIEFLQHAYTSDIELVQDQPESESDHFGRILALLRTHSKYDFRFYRKNMLTRRIQRRMRLNHIDGLSEYLDLLREKEDEIKLLFRDLLIGVTGFFREPEAFKVLEQRVIPQLVKHENTDSPIRVWIPGCATGEEAYSIAILLAEQFALAKKTFNVQIFATDIDESALEYARNAIYPESITTDISEERLKRFFTQTDSHYQINKNIREAVVFAAQNLISDAPFSKLDLVSCRNLLIYLEPQIQQKVISLFHFALNNDGYLLLGSSETVGRQLDLFETVSKKWRVFRRIGVNRRNIVDFPIVSTDNRRPHVQHALTPQARSGINLAELTQRQLLEDFTPASVLINRKYEILYYHGPTDYFLSQPDGEPTRDLIDLAREGLRTKIRAACHKAVNNNETVYDSSARVKHEGIWHLCTLRVKPFTEPREAEGLLLVSFQPRENLPDTLLLAESSSINGKIEESDAFHQLEYELKATREDLHNSIEELGNSNVELKVSNEEIMSMNEELQSSNEELETSKEELQSLNEELSTVNSQLNDKLEELDNAHNDMSNLLNSTDIATLYLDTNFCIRQFTPATAKLLGLIANDSGRPINRFATDFTGKDLLDDANKVLETLARVETEIWVGETCYLRRILPYRTTENRIEGVLVTFLDISQRKQTEIDEREIERLRGMVENLPAGAVYVDHEKIMINRATEKMTGFSREELSNLDAWFSILFGDREQKMRAIYEAERNAGFPHPSEPFSIICKNGDERLIVYSAYRFDDHEVWLLNDITLQKQAENALHESKDRMRTILDSTNDAIVTTDNNGIIVDINPMTETLFGYTRGELIGHNVRMLMPEPHRSHHDGYIQRYNDTGKAHIIGIGREVTALRKDGSTFPVDLSISKVDDLGLFTGIIRDITENKRLQRKILQVAAEENQRIGSELHDNIQQQLVALSMLCRSLLKDLHSSWDGELPKDIQELLEMIINNIQQTGEQTRLLAHGLMPVAISGRGLFHALAELANRTSIQNDIKCNFGNGLDFELENNFIATHLYMIAQELVVNAIKHGKPEHIDINLSSQLDSLVLTISDDGIGMDEMDKHKGGSGFDIMGYRASIIGATLEIRPGVKHGTKIVCTLPIKGLVKRENEDGR